MNGSNAPFGNLMLNRLRVTGEYASGHASQSFGVLTFLVILLAGGVTIHNALFDRDDEQQA